MRPLPTFRQLLVLVVLGCLLPMAGLALGLVAYEYDRDRGHVEREALATARGLMAAADDRFESVQAAQMSLAQASIDSAWLQGLLVRQRLPSTWIAAVLDRSGKIVARTHEPERFVGVRARADLLEHIAQAPEGAVEAITVDGIPVVSAYSRSDRTGWAVVVGMPRAELRAPLLQGTILLFAGTGAVLLMSLWLAWRLSRNLSESLEVLGGAVRASGHGALLDLPPPVFQEAHQLGQALLHANAVVEDATHAQKRTEHRIQSVLETAMDGIITADASGRIVLFNRAAQAMFRLPQDEALGMQVEELMPRAFRTRHRMLRQQATPVSARQMAPGRVVEALRSDGSTFKAQASISVTDEDDERLYTVILRPVNWGEDRAAPQAASTTSAAVRNASSAAGKPQ